MSINIKPDAAVFFTTLFCSLAGMGQHSQERNSLLAG